MGLLGDILKRTEQIIKSETNSLVNKIENKAAGTAAKEVNDTIKNYHLTTRTFTYDSLPVTLDELKAVQKNPKDYFETAALAVLALNVYADFPEECEAMIDYLNGPDSVAVRDMQLIRTQFMEGGRYTVRSYFKGATPENNYTASLPLTITVHDNPYSYDNSKEGYVSLYIPSGGADNDRKVTLRTKPSTGEWFIYSWQGLLMGIRTAKEADSWA